MTKTPLLLLILFGLLLGGCSDQKAQQQLQQTLQDIRNRPSGRIEPLPERIESPAVQYMGSSARSPFSLYDEQAQSTTITRDERFKPDQNRPRSTLEQQPLESLSLVGTLRFTDQSKFTALVDDGHGVIHKVTIGHYLGQDFGRVAEITEDTIFIEETVQDEQGGWIKRPRQLKLAALTNE